MKLVKRGAKIAAKRGAKAGAKTLLPGVGEAWMIYDAAPVAYREARGHLRDMQEGYREFRDAKTWKGRGKAVARTGGKSAIRTMVAGPKIAAAALLNPKMSKDDLEMLARMAPDFEDVTREELRATAKAARDAHKAFKDRDWRAGARVVGRRAAGITRSSLRMAESALRADQAMRRRKGKSMRARRNPQASPTVVRSMTLLLSLLRAQQWVTWNAHWKAHGPQAYGDHLLFERIYKDLTENLDGLGERLVAQGGFDEVQVSQDALSMLKSLSKRSRRDQFMHLYEAATVLIDRILEERPPTGLRVFVENLAEKQDEYAYLVGQTLAKANGSTKAGGYPFAQKQDQYRFFTKAQLKWAAQDAWQAAQACRTHDPIAEGWYMDDLATIQQELNARAGRTARTNCCSRGARGNPCGCGRARRNEWIQGGRASGKPFSKYDRDQLRRGTKAKAARRRRKKRI